MSQALAQVDIEGLAAVKQAFKRLEFKTANKVIRKAERTALKPALADLKANTPFESGRMRRSAKIRTSKGPRTAKRGMISLALMIGEAGQKGDKEAGIRRAFYTFMQNYGWHTGIRIRRRERTVGYRKGAQGQAAGKEITPKAKGFVQKVLKSHESRIKETMNAEILAGIEREAGRR